MAGLWVVTLVSALAEGNGCRADDEPACEVPAREVPGREVPVREVPGR